MNFAVPPWLKNLARARNGSRAHLALLGGGAVVAAILIFAIATKEIAHHHRAIEAMSVATATANVQPFQHAQHAAPPPVRGALMTSIVGSAPVTPAAVPTAPPTPAQIAVSPAATLAPPAGLVAGEVIDSIANADQYGQYTTVSTHAAGAIRTSWQSHVSAPNSPAWQETFAGWFQLSAPSTIAALRVGSSGAARTVSAAIDGASLGAPLGLGPASETAALSLAAGWHGFIVTAEGGRLNYAPPATSIELLIGDGTNAPATVVPYAVTSQPAAAAHAATSAPVTSASPVSAVAAPSSARVLR